MKLSIPGRKWIWECNHQWIQAITPMTLKRWEEHPELRIENRCCPYCSEKRIKKIIEIKGD